ncbi:bifunctional 4-hydroxy-2-oxoglutarate aldolase/2-dehydro-3-deoxy-phosphogluconate aldolase [Piscinibacterium candidicorallinum]|uniref:2-dehydro-3-deoxy-phosphogluconate aldolase n=1 Tax=Piscinibacterium candidicorallinum TaxID=1793872 RepID=A0ABV7H7T6_9BURK
MQIDIDALMGDGPVIPVIVIDDVAQAKPLAQTLVEAGVRVLEVTLRTPAALAAIEAMRGVQGAIVGAGTVTTPDAMRQAVDAGSQFMVSPGLTPTLAAAARNVTVPLLPGVVTPSEVMQARDAGFTRLKFFPAEPMGGVPVLKAYASVFRDVRFCPTGGITLQSAPSFLSLPNVSCIGGSWFVAPADVAAGRWAQIGAQAREAASLARPNS